jgi:hypothetical protein
MGLALRLFPIDRLWNGGTEGFSHTVLELGSISWDLGEVLREKARRLPDGHDISALLAGIIPDGYARGERYYGKLNTDAYGEPYRWLTARELSIYLDEHWPKHPTTAYVRAMKPDDLVVLDWR